MCLLRCRRSPTSGFVRPSATSRTTLSSWPLSFGSSVLRASISTAAARGSITLSPASTRSIARPRSRSSASVTRKPRAPESSAASTALSSRSAESTMTAVPGCRFRIAAQTSAPEPSGSLESSSTTSGRCSTAVATASVPLSASATTLAPLATSSAQIPRRTIRFGSTTRTRAAIPVMVDPPHRGDGRPATRGLPTDRWKGHREAHGEGAVSLRATGVCRARWSGPARRQRGRSG